MKMCPNTNNKPNLNSNQKTIRSHHFTASNDQGREKNIIFQVFLELIFNFFQNIFELLKLTISIFS